MVTFAGTIHHQLSTIYFFAPRFSRRLRGSAVAFLVKQMKFPTADAMLTKMELRPVTLADLDALCDIDGTIESTEYLHLEQSGEGLSIGWKLDRRPLRQKLIDGNPLSDESHFAVKQIATGADDGLAILAEHDVLPVGLLVATLRHDLTVLELIDLRIDYDHRRQGVATAMIFQAINFAASARRVPCSPTRSRTICRQASSSSKTPSIYRASIPGECRIMMS